MRIDFGCLVLAAAVGAGGSQPARLSETDAPLKTPSLPAQGQAAFEVDVDSRGRVAGVRLLYGRAPLSQALEEALAGWTFRPARHHGLPGPSHVLVAALCRAAALYPIEPCPPPTPATPVVPGRVPAPVSACPPAYPAQARESGAVVVEVEIGPTGHVRSARAVGPRTVFTGAAEQAARAWRFVPREPQSRMTPTMAYLVFGFPRPGPAAGPD